MASKRIKLGIIGGLVGGVAFGMMMAMMGTLPMIAGMVGSTSPLVGFALHMMISAGIGAGFGLVLGGRIYGLGSSLLHGLVYGAAWWVLGPLTLMPFMMGMGLGVNWNLAAANAMLPSLFGHIIFGLLLGFSFHRGLIRQSAVRIEEPRPQPRAV